MRTHARNHCGEKSKLCQPGGEQLTADLKRMGHSQVHCEGEMCAYQRFSRDFMQGRCPVHDDQDDTSERTYVGRIQSLQGTLSRYTIGGELQEYESTRVCPYDGVTRQKEESCDTCKPECDWQLAVEPFVKLHRLF